MGCCDGFFGVVLRNESGVVVERCIAFAAETIKDGQQSGVPLIEVLPDEVDNHNVMAWLTAGSQSVAEHEGQRGAQHRFVRLLKTSLFIKFEDLPGR